MDSAGAAAAGAAAAGGGGGVTWDGLFAESAFAVGERTQERMSAWAARGHEVELDEGRAAHEQEQYDGAGTQLNSCATSSETTFKGLLQRIREEEPSSTGEEHASSASSSRESGRSCMEGRSRHKQEMNAGPEKDWNTQRAQVDTGHERLAIEVVRKRARFDSERSAADCRVVHGEVESQASTGLSGVLKGGSQSSFSVGHSAAASGAAQVAAPCVRRRNDESSMETDAKSTSACRASSQLVNQQRFFGQVLKYKTWTRSELQRYLDGLRMYGKQISRLATFIGTRSKEQVRSRYDRARKHILKALRESGYKDINGFLETQLNQAIIEFEMKTLSTLEESDSVANRICAPPVSLKRKRVGVDATSSEAELNIEEEEAKQQKKAIQCPEQRMKKDCESREQSLQPSTRILVSASRPQMEHKETRQRLDSHTIQHSDASKHTMAAEMLSVQVLPFSEIDASLLRPVKQNPKLLVRVKGTHTISGLEVHLESKWKEVLVSSGKRLHIVQLDPSKECGFSRVTGTVHSAFVHQGQPRMFRLLYRFESPPPEPLKGNAGEFVVFLENGEGENTTFAREASRVDFLDSAFAAAPARAQDSQRQQRERLMRRDHVQDLGHSTTSRAGLLLFEQEHANLEAPAEFDPQHHQTEGEAREDMPAFSSDLWLAVGANRNEGSTTNSFLDAVLQRSVARSSDRIAGPGSEAGMPSNLVHDHDHRQTDFMQTQFNSSFWLASPGDCARGASPRGDSLFLRSPSDAAVASHPTSLFPN
ncbi:hypothetical protein FVE85_1045 [Porphyridium purpureum]|uniref:SANT domain-containing protein n=1 Tax=Porphyridium purpureum TaxID=35688 RepID=A0A5J4Z126_PORPP|nr:hypothetical protein FVE85_1045 [Porphyridium purpureum]|eukprot:POR1419..scf208_2